LSSYDIQIRRTDDTGGGNIQIRWDVELAGIPTRQEAIDRAAALPSPDGSLLTWRVMRRDDDGITYEQVELHDPAAAPASQPRTGIKIRRPGRGT
jgi:hypothetical protein